MDSLQSLLQGSVWMSRHNGILQPLLKKKRILLQRFDAFLQEYRIAQEYNMYLALEA